MGGGVRLALAGGRRLRLLGNLGLLVHCDLHALRADGLPVGANRPMVLDRCDCSERPARRKPRPTEDLLGPDRKGGSIAKARHDNPIAPCRLGAIERFIRGVEQRFACRPVLGERGHPD